MASRSRSTTQSVTPESLHGRVNMSLQSPEDIKELHCTYTLHMSANKTLSHLTSDGPFTAPWYYVQYHSPLTLPHLHRGPDISITTAPHMEHRIVARGGFHLPSPPPHYPRARLTINRSGQKGHDIPVQMRCADDTNWTFSHRGAPYIWVSFEGGRRLELSVASLSSEPPYASASGPVLAHWIDAVDLRQRYTTAPDNWTYGAVH
ncbi:hypothetical protein CC86DRAFT_366827 [Ophiobolus disseminans]|uniref:Uncharacterized protein n=1 Tax=Ophiobolus disseminans TaxID=1469910 RepID=A0A6A7AE24_9PLEO|nr:hypothetical protein CC86DRAFT_366827 [Ophiobolus disseminans]